MPAGPDTGTVRTEAELLALYADYAAVFSSNRQLHRDEIVSLVSIAEDYADAGDIATLASAADYADDAPWPILPAEVGLVTLANSRLYPYGDVRRFGWTAAGTLAANTAAIQAANDATPNYPTPAGEITFPPETTVKIDDTIHVGRFSVDGNDNVLGFTGVKLNMSWNLNGSILQWEGADQPGTTKVVKTDSVGTYDLITDDKPMVSVVAGEGFTMRNGRLLGLSADGTRRAYSPVDFQGNHSSHTFENIRTLGARLGWRHGRAWDHELNVQYWGYADSPYYKANVYNAPAVGGWQGDTQTYRTCSFAGTLLHLSTESGQNLSIDFGALLLGEGSTTGLFGIVMVGGRITADGIGFIQATTDNVKMWTGSNHFSARGYHSESAAGGRITTSTNAAVPRITLIDGDTVNVVLAGGGGQLTIEDFGTVSITRSDVAARADISVINCGIAGFVISNTGARENLNIALKNCGLTAAILAGATATNCYLDVDNCQPMSNLPPFVGTWRALYESFEGSDHKVWNKLSIPHNAATLVGTIAAGAAGTSSAGSALLRITWGTPVSVNAAGVSGLYSFAWCRDSGGVFTVSAVRVVYEDKPLDGIAAFTVTVTAAVSGTNILVNVQHANTPAVAATAELSGKVYAGGRFTTARTPIWTPAA